MAEGVVNHLKTPAVLTAKNSPEEPETVMVLE